MDLEGFGRCMEAQRERARAANTKDAEAAWSTYGGVHADILEATGPTRFVGYGQLESPAQVLALVKDGKRVERLEAGESGEVVLDATPFYAEMGGEVGDTGTHQRRWPGCSADGAGHGRAGKGFGPCIKREGGRRCRAHEATT